MLPTLMMVPVPRAAIFGARAATRKYGRPSVPSSAGLPAQRISGVRASLPYPHLLPGNGSWDRSSRSE